jgi:hypothetical protein
MQVERRLRALPAPGSRVQAYRVAVHPRVLPLLAGPGGARLAAIEEATRKRFFLVEAEGHAHVDHLDVLAEGKLVDLQPAVPVAEGSTVELKLGEVGLYDAAAAVGKLDGIDVTVAGAAKLVGKKANVLVGRVLEGQAFGTLVSEGETVEGPITFESEAEKPTRAPARRKTALPESEAGPGEAGEGADETLTEPPVDLGAVVAAEPDEHETEAEDEDEAEDAAEAVADGDGDAPAPKKKTRRGSRGGKRRRKKPADGAAPDEASDEAGADAGPREDVESGELAAEAPAPPAADGDGGPPAPRERRPRARIHLPETAEPAKSKNGGRAASAAAAVLEDVIAEADAELAAASEAAGAVEDANVDGAKPAAKKRTRRGTRGGRNRRKPGAAAGDGSEAGVETDGAGGVEAPEEDVVSGEAEAAAAEDDVTERPARVPREAPLEVVSEQPEGYVPMSEWLDDFDRR